MKLARLPNYPSYDLSKISENTKAALAKKRAAGVQLGAPTKSEEIVNQVRRLKEGGASNQVIARALKISLTTVAKYLVS